MMIGLPDTRPAMQGRDSLLKGLLSRTPPGQRNNMGSPTAEQASPTTDDQLGKMKEMITIMMEQMQAMLAMLDQMAPDTSMTAGGGG